MASQSDADLLKLYLRIIDSFKMGLLRLWRAEAASARAHCALVAFHSIPSCSLEGNPYREALENLKKVAFDSYDADAYVTNVSHLVYATSLLDTFLSDTTLFLLLRHPKAIGTRKQLSLETVLGASSIHAVLSKTAAQKAREISYLSFSERLNFLSDTFGLSLQIKQENLDALTHHTSVRNAAVHDQGIFDISLDDSGALVAHQKTCRRHPTHVTWHDVHNATACYETVGEAVGCAVLTQVLKVAADHPALHLVRHRAIRAKATATSSFTGQPELSDKKK